MASVVTGTSCSQDSRSLIRAQPFELESAASVGGRVVPEHTAGTSANHRKHQQRIAAVVLSAGRGAVTVARSALAWLVKFCQ